MWNFISLSTIFIFLIAAGFFFWSFWQLRRTSENRKLQERLDAFSAPEEHSFIIEQQGIFKENRDNQIKKKIDYFIKSALEERRPSFYKRVLINPHLKYIGPLLLIGAFLLYEFCYNYLFQPSIVSLGLALVISSVFSSFVYNILENKRQQAFLKNFPTALDLITRGLRAGLSIDKAFATITRELPGSVGQEFEKIIEQIRLGVPFQNALLNSAIRVKLSDYDFFVLSLIIQRRVGGSIADFMENVARIVRKREELNLKVKSMSAEAKATGLIIGSLPFIVLVVISIVSPDYTNVFRFHPTGQKLFLVAIGIIFVAGIVVNRMTKIKLD
ncbi:MAG: type II secretion system F family protein [Alphaproteobacteria bacterium]|nr:type II secretion system F family protein [Alphaproteobacteria bacterium]